MKILDLSAGRRAIWFNKKNPKAIYCDIRPEVHPDIVIDTRDLGDKVGSGFNLIVFDPPHMNCGPNSNMSKVYGYHTTAQILDTIQKTSGEAWRVSRANSLMAFKWNTHDIKLNRVSALMTEWEPLFGHLTKDGPGSQTYWVMLRRKSEREIGAEGVASALNKKSQMPKCEAGHNTKTRIGDRCIVCDRPLKTTASKKRGAGIKCMKDAGGPAAIEQRIFSAFGQTDMFSK